MRNNIIYYFINNKKINGTLFYCFEYFIFCNKYKQTDFLLYDINEKDLNFIKEVFKDRYVFDHTLLDQLKIIPSKISLLKENTYNKTLFLDVRSFRNLFPFVRNKDNDILCFSNDTHINERSKTNKITYYGSYDYQVFDKEAILKLNFNIFKPIKEKKNIESMNALVSAPFIEPNTIVKYLPIKEDNIIYKENNHSHESFFENFDTMYYYHTTRDTNNRLIPECFFYNKNVHIEYNGNYDDSIFIRHEDIKNNGVEKYRLSKNDILISDFLNI